MPGTAPPPKPYEAPIPPLGVVKWATNPGADPESWVPAIVTRRSRGAICVFVVPDSSRGGVPFDAVRHVSDPQFPILKDQSSGVWDYTDEYKRLVALEAQVAALIASQPPAKK